MAKRKGRRRDTNGNTLRTGESYNTKKDLYCYRYTYHGDRKAIYAKTLDELRQKEDKIIVDRYDSIRDAGTMNVNDMYEIWITGKKGIRGNTLRNYKYMYDTYCKNTIGKMGLTDVRKSNVVKFYDDLRKNKHLSVNTIDSISTSLSQVFKCAVEDELLRKNPASGAMGEFRRINKENVKAHALTQKEETEFFNFIKDHKTYSYWWGVFMLILTTGMRVSEATGLQWGDIDLKNGWITIDKSLIYYQHPERDGKRACFEMHKNIVKTPASLRKIPILNKTREALEAIRKYNAITGRKSEQEVGGYKNFVLINRFNHCYEQSMLNSAIRRIISDYNDMKRREAEKEGVSFEECFQIRGFSCHCLRHTYATRQATAGVSPKTLQTWMGHREITTTLDIYTEASEEMQQADIEKVKDIF